MKWNNQRYWLIAIIPVFVFSCHNESDNPDDDTLSAEVLMIQKGCTSCHQLQKLQAATGLVGPPLDAMSQKTYIAGVLPNTEENLVKWLMNPQHFHVASAMPNSNITPQEAIKISAYLWRD